MACGCGTPQKGGKAIVDKVRLKGMDAAQMPKAHELTCQACATEFTMVTYVDQCPNCQMVYGVTPCSADQVENIKPAAVNY
ncbi:MAG: hypothetical protein ACRC6H_02460 [Culicoidibacterales bacterium]